MKIIIGLGNPGEKYESTRHNIGFMFIDFYAKIKQISAFSSEFNGLVAKFKEQNETIILVKPTTFMNLSGNCVKAIVDYYNVSLDDIVVIYDDKDIPFAKLRLRQKGKPGAHNGIKHITQMLGSNDFKRARVGIGAPESNKDMVDFVLSKFTKDELKAINDSYSNLALAMDLFIKNDFNKAMNLYNFKKENESTN